MKTVIFFIIALITAPALAQVPFITGGIGKAEREMVLAQKKNYNFEVKVALKSGHFVSDVALSITDSSGKEALKASTDGPLFFAKLPAGEYHITAHYKGQSEKQRFSIAANTTMREAIFRFESNEEIVDAE